MSTLSENTPEVTVYDNAGLTIRQLGYYRRVVGETRVIRIHLHRYNANGQQIASLDPRLSAAYLENPREVIPNQQQGNTLSGRVLLSQNVDAGTRVLFSDVQGQALWQWDSRGTQQAYEYDELRRVKTIDEKERGQERFCRERFRYGEAKDGQGNNRIGRLRAHYDTGGCCEIPAYRLLGRASSEVRRFIKAEEMIDWTEADEENVQRLEESAYTSQWRANALNEVVSQTDAGGSEQTLHYDVAGQINEIRWRQPAGEEKILTQSRVYNARSQLQKEKLGNGVSVEYDYETETPRLREKLARRSADSVLLQCLHYTYDPVGNIVAIENKTQAIAYYKNTKMEPIRHYRYDSFYQLISASGCESEQTSQRISGGSEAIVFGNQDSRRLVPYQRDYQYDAGGNLYEIQHRGGQPYTQALEIDRCSNRGIEKRSSGPNLQASFDGNGNLLYLTMEKPLSWNARNQLEKTVQVERSEDVSDEERYVYDGAGMRLQKTRHYLTGNQRHTERVRYLPSLELREHWQSTRQGEEVELKERLLVTEIGSDIPVKVLHWELGRPAGIENDGVYYRLTDQIGSGQIELNEAGACVSYEDYYPYGGTAIWSAPNQIEASYKYKRYSGKERDYSGLYYYGYRYYLPWLGRWLNADPSGISDGLNLFCMVHNNPISFYDEEGKLPEKLTKLHPDTKTDKEGNVYRPIPVLNRSGDLIRNIRLMQTGAEIGLSPLTFYVLTTETRAKRLILYAHGTTNRRSVVPLSETTLTITIFSAQGETVQILDNKKEISNLPYAKISSKGILLTSQQAKEDYESGEEGYAKLTGTTEKGAIHNYLFSKLETKYEGSSHLLKILANAVTNSHSATERKKQEPFDVLTIRKSRSLRFATLTDVLKLAKVWGYNEVGLINCRNSSQSLIKEIYQPEANTLLLEAPEFKAWNGASVSPSKSFWRSLQERFF